METRSNYVLVGSVTLALLVGLLIFIVWLAGMGVGAFVSGVGPWLSACACAAPPSATVTPTRRRDA